MQVSRWCHIPTRLMMQRGSNGNVRGVVLEWAKLIATSLAISVITTVVGFAMLGGS